MTALPDNNVMQDLCRRHWYKGVSLPINCVECQAEAEADYYSEQQESSDDE